MLQGFTVLQNWGICTKSRTEQVGTQKHLQEASLSPFPTSLESPHGLSPFPAPSLFLGLPTTRLTNSWRSGGRALGRQVLGREVTSAGQYSDETSPLHLSSSDPSILVRAGPSKSSLQGKKDPAPSPWILLTESWPGILWLPYHFCILTSPQFLFVF